MTRIENDCCDCGLHDCYMCSLREVEHHYCDYCGEEIDGGYLFGGEELCYDCACELYPVEMEVDDD